MLRPAAQTVLPAPAQLRWRLEDQPDCGYDGVASDVGLSCHAARMSARMAHIAPLISATVRNHRVDREDRSGQPGDALTERRWRYSDDRGKGAPISALQ